MGIVPTTFEAGQGAASYRCRSAEVKDVVQEAFALLASVGVVLVVAVVLALVSVAAAVLPVLFFPSLGAVQQLLHFSGVKPDAAALRTDVDLDTTTGNLTHRDVA